MRFNWTIVAILTFLTLSGCGGRKATRSSSTPSAAASVAVTPATPALSECEIRRGAFAGRADLVSEPVQDVTIERDFQRVVRKDCHGKVTSDGVETIHSPNLFVNLSPSVPLPTSAGGAELFNSETCDDMGVDLPSRDLSWLPLFGGLYTISGGTDGSLKVETDTSPAVLTFHVNQGLNHIYYRYTTGCLPDSTDRKLTVGESADEPCAVSPEIRAGVYLLNVNYIEKHLDGGLEHQDDECESKTDPQQ